PELGPGGRRVRVILPGEPPDATSPPPGCVFHPRCPLAVDRCRTEVPLLRPVGPDRMAACHRAEEGLATASALPGQEPASTAGSRTCPSRSGRRHSGPVDGYTVGEVARLARISVRTLHHYDGIGLLTPSARSAGGYRLYTETDLHRLRRVLFYRELDFGLDEI